MALDVLGCALMKIMMLICVLCVAISPAMASADASSVSDIALASFEHVSKDKCVHTVGELALVRADPGAENASGVYITGSQENVCLGTGNGFASFTEATFPMLGLYYSRFTGTVLAPSYSSGEDITFEINLTWRGQGPITRTSDGDDTTVTSNATRGARTRGYVRANGVTMKIVSAQLGHQTSSPVTP